MCAIAGVVSECGAAAGDVERMLAAVAHRGPDDRHRLAMPQAVLGHRRLAIIDIEHAKQPMASDDGRFWLTFNGEIYNYRELAPRFAEERPLRTRSDTEVLLRSFEAHGIACLHDLRGMFAFGVLDTRTRRLVLARDPLGQKPLYYWHDGERLAFASEIKALLALEPGLAELDPDALHEYLTLRFVSAPRSMFRRIRKLPPGHYLVFERGRLAVEPYWQLDFTRKRSAPLGEAVDELDERVRDAVQSHLVSDVPVGAFLSGGMDSSLVAATMYAVGESSYPVFTGDVPYRRRSELPYARAVAERYGMTHRHVEIRPVLARALARTLSYLDEPADPLAICLYELAGLARTHVKVVLGGDGGDELFGGYDRYYGNLYASYYALLPPAVRRRVLGPLATKFAGRRRWYRSMEHRLKWLQYLAAERGGARYARSLRYFHFTEEHCERLYTPGFRTAISAFHPERALAQWYDTASAREALDRMLAVDYRARLPDHPVMILDRMTMAHGLEARSPLLDRRLVEYCATLAPELKVQGSRLRVIEKALAERYLPREVLKRPKQGFSSAMPYLLDAQISALQRRLFADSALVADGYLNGGGVAELVAEHRARRADHAQRLWLVATAELWYRLFVRGEESRQVEASLLREVA